MGQELETIPQVNFKPNIKDLVIEGMIKLGLLTEEDS